MKKKIKHCIYCGEEFIPAANASKTCSVECSNIHKKIVDKKWYTDRPEYSSNNNFKRRYGMERHEVLGMLEGQSGKCAICNRDIQFPNARVDHCHSTGKVRGILCHPCNSVLGLAKDSTNVLKNAIDYLIRSQ